MCCNINIENIKKIFWISLSVLLIACAIWTIISIKPMVDWAKSLQPARVIAVSGEGKVTVIPDIAVVSFSVVTEGKDPSTIASDNNNKVNAAIAYVKGQGVDVKDVKTTGYNLSPRYEYDKDKRSSFISGYTITQTIQVKLRDFSKIGQILGTLPQLGINNIGNLDFSVDEPENFLNQAREMAFNKAYEKAKIMAKQNNVQIKRVVTFAESQGGYSYPIYRDSVLKAAPMAEIVTPQIEPGSQEVTVDVTVTYEIK